MFFLLEKLLLLTPPCSASLQKLYAFWCTPLALIYPLNIISRFCIYLYDVAFVDEERR